MLEVCLGQDLKTLCSRSAWARPVDTMLGVASQVLTQTYDPGMSAFRSTLSRSNNSDLKPTVPRQSPRQCFKL